MMMPGDPYGRAGSFTDKSDALNEKALEFIEAMMMPSRIWAGNNGYGTYWQTDASDKDTPYIRKDLCDELALALETIHSQTNDGLARRIAGDALSSYRALAD